MCLLVAPVWADGDGAEIGPPLWTPDTRYDPPIMTLNKDLYDQGNHVTRYGWMKLAKDCPTTFAAKWTAGGQAREDGMGSVVFHSNGTAEWKWHGTMQFERFDDRRTTAILKMKSPFTGKVRDRGPIVVISYPYLTHAGSADMCYMALYTCPSYEAIQDLYDGDGFLRQCQKVFYYISQWGDW